MPLSLHSSVNQNLNIKIRVRTEELFYLFYFDFFLKIFLPVKYFSVFNFFQLRRLFFRGYSVHSPSFSLILSNLEKMYPFFWQRDSVIYISIHLLFSLRNLILREYIKHQTPTFASKAMILCSTTMKYYCLLVLLACVFYESKKHRITFHAIRTDSHCHL